MRFVRSWRYVGPVLIFLMVGLGCWLYFRYPLLANPVYVAAKLQRGGIDQKTIEWMAAWLPVALCLLFFFALSSILLTFISFSNEKKYLDIFTREAVNGGQKPNNSAGTATLTAAP